MNKFKLIASAAYRWSECPGSVHLESKMTEKIDERSPAAIFGTMLHDIGEGMIKGESMTAMFRKHGIKRDHPELDRIKHTVQFYKKAVNRIKNEYTKKNGKSSMNIEEKIRYTIEHPELDNVYENVAKMDCMFVNSDKKVLELNVIDLKTGNWDYTDSAQIQLDYTGALAVLTTKKKYEKIIINTTIVQPYLWDDNNRVVYGQYETTRDEIQENLFDSLFRIDNGAGKCISGSHCTFCSALPVCPVMGHYVETINQTIQISGMEITDFSTEFLESVYSQKKSIENFLSQIEKVLIKQAQDGVELKHYNIGKRLGNRKWRDEKEVVKKFKYLGEDIYNKKLKTPAQLEKLAGKENLSEYCDRSETPMLEKKKETSFDILE